MAFLQLLTSAAATLGLYGAYQLLKFAYKEYTSPLHDLPGPKSSSWLFGNLKEIFAADNSVLQERWVQEYGHTIKYSVQFGTMRLFTMDTKALNHVLTNSYDYQKPFVTRYNLGRIVGPGVLVVEEDKHRQQRRIMNPAFGPAQIRELTEIFIRKAIQLRDIWMAVAIKEAGSVGTTRIDAVSWLSRTTLDIIGLAGFNYKFDALSENSKPNELNQAFATIFKAGTRQDILPALQAWFPIFRIFPTERGPQIHQAQSAMLRIGKQILKDSKASLSLAPKTERSSSRTKDLLSLLLKANTSVDIPDSQRLSDEDVLAQVPTFLVAGHETTRIGTTWALFALTQDPEVQTKLRNELLSVPTDNPTMDELNALPYLDCVVRETLRIHAPVPSTVRIAMKDDVLPLNTPFTDKKGNVHHGIRVRKGQTIFIPILAMNRARDIWGEDSMEFRPERWKSTPEAASSIPGVWSNMLTFLGGPRSCIGYRFSLVEMKALLFTLVRSFEFELAVPANDIVKRSTIVQRPVVVSDPEGGNQMPLLVKPYKPRV